MQLTLSSIARLIVPILAFIADDMAYAGGRFSQIVLPFPNERKYQVTTDEQKNAVILHIDKTSPAELEALDHYDERLIRRLFIKDLGPQGTDVEFILKDRMVKASVAHFTEPFRITLDVFDRNYENEVDPYSGLPLVAVQTSGTATDEQQKAGRPRLLAPGGDAAASKDSQVQNSSGTGTAIDTGTQESPGKRRLLQPTPEEVTDPGTLQQLMTSAPEGRAKSWSEYPIYVYPIQTAAYEGRDKPAGWIKSEASKALSSAQAMAEYAYKLFSFGHEGRALLAYQQVLHKDASIFAKDALHLWAFAEVHLAHGNLALADGYYDTMLEKHPDSPLAKFAQLRKLDIKAIRLVKTKRTQELSELLADLNRIQPGPSGELKAQTSIRRAYWSQQGIEGDGRSRYVPIVDENTESNLALAHGSVESQRTSFLSASIILKNLIRADRPWENRAGSFADQYFKNFRGPSFEPIYSQLKDELHSRLSKHFTSLYAEHKYPQATQSYDVLPNPLKSVSKSSEVAWALAESYRAQDMRPQALTSYEQALSGMGSGTRKVQALFWVSYLSAAIADTTKGTDQAKRDAVLRRSRSADQEVLREWAALAEDDRIKISTAYKDDFEKAVQSNFKLKSPAEIVLESWTKGLSSRMEGTNAGGENQWSKNFSPNSSSIYLLGALAKKFDQLGSVDKRRQAIKIMQSIKPDEFASDKAARETWNRELTSLAEEYRKDNNFLEAGRLLTFTASNSGDPATRAESLYKGALLLYRAGQREEAMKAFTQASEDGNNIFYANLAKERLNQLKN